MNPLKASLLIKLEDVTDTCPTTCDLCKITFKTANGLKRHCNGKSHKIFAREQFILDLLKRTPHDKKAKEEVLEQTKCDLCDFTVLNANNFKSHLLEVHYKFNKRTSVRNQIENTNDYQFIPTKCEFCHIKIKSVRASIKHYSGKVHRRNKKCELREQQLREIAENEFHDKMYSNQSTLVYCQICQKYLLRTDKRDHIINFPHLDLAVLGLVGWKKGRKPFWQTHTIGVSCLLCSTHCRRSTTFRKHCSSESHTKKYLKCSGLLAVDEDSPTDKCFCSVCNLLLDGTSDSTKHYNQPRHKLMQTEKSTNSTDLANQTIPKFMKKIQAEKFSKPLEEQQLCEEIQTLVSAFQDPNCPLLEGLQCLIQANLDLSSK